MPDDELTDLSRRIDELLKVAQADIEMLLETLREVKKLAERRDSLDKPDDRF